MDDNMWKPFKDKKYVLFYCTNKNIKKCKSIKRIHENGDITTSGHSKSCYALQKKLKIKSQVLRHPEKKFDIESSVLVYATEEEDKTMTENDNLSIELNLKTDKPNTLYEKVCKLLLKEPSLQETISIRNLTEDDEINITNSIEEPISKNNFQGLPKTHETYQEFLIKNKLALPNKEIKETRLKLPKQTEKEAFHLKTTLLAAINEKKMFFSDDLKFPHGKLKIPGKYLKDIQELSIKNIHIFEEFKVGFRKFNYGPLVVEKMEPQGFVVKSTNKIPSHTIIAEYAGSVVPYDSKTMEKADSIMNYIRYDGIDYVIQPEPFANLARFISGINNLFEDLKLPNRIKKNLESLQFRLDDHIHIILYTSRVIEKNEILAYDYNNGQRKNHEEDMYPTDTFI